MRKFTKILTVLLALSLLCGTLAVAISATNYAVKGHDGTGNLLVSGDKIEQYAAADMEDDNAYGGWATMYYTGDGLGDNFNIVTGANGNKYAQYYVPLDEAQGAQGAWVQPLGGRIQNAEVKGTTTSLLENDYVVMDFEFCADKYVDANGKVTDNPDGAVSLSYTTMNLQFFVR